MTCCQRIGADIAERWVPSSVGYGTENEKALFMAGIRAESVQKGDRILWEYRTPVGTLTRVARATTEAGSTVFREEHLVKGSSDLRAYQYLWEAMRIEANYDATQEHIARIGEEGMAWLHVPCTPLLYLIMYDLGLELTAYLLNDYAEAMQRLMGVMAEKALAACRLAAASPGEVGIVAENSGTLLAHRHSSSATARRCSLSTPASSMTRASCSCCTRVVTCVDCYPSSHAQDWTASNRSPPHRRATSNWPTHARC